jgi:alkaline phosphatase D
MSKQPLRLSQFPTSPAGRPLTRRRFLGRSARVLGTTAFVSSVGFPAIVRARPRRGAFAHGVASGDPLPEAVLLWTRVTPSDEATPGSGLGVPALVRWEVSLTPDFWKIVRKGQVLATAASDHTVKVDVTGLQPATTYYYRFLFKETSSPVGRTRTAPAADAAVSSLRFGLASCSNYEAGYFAAYRHMAARNDLDFVLHVGDYIYEYESGAYGPGPAIGRVHDPLTEIITLSDYRRRHAQYREDADLQALHAAYPFVCTWDDHELTNDTYNGGAENHQPGTEGDFFARRAAAYRAYFEWMPIRLPDPLNAPSRIYRKFQFGSLADLLMLDLRQYRDQQPLSGADPARDHPDRVIVGREQLDWLKGELGASSALWKLVGNSVMIAPIDFRNPFIPPELLAQLGLMMGVPFNVDSWDGYTDDRRELLDHVAANDIRNVTFLTGDIHSSWACEVPRDSLAYLGGVPPAAVEIVGTSITSDNLNEILGAPPRNPLSQQVETLFKAANQHVKLLEFDSHGYSVVDLTPQRLQADWYYISERTDVNATQQFATAYQVPAGTNRLLPAAGPLGPRA